MATTKKELNHAECVERDLKEWKKIFSLSEKAYGYRINAYKGTQKLVFIPDIIDGMKVAFVQDDSFPADTAVICSKRIFDKMASRICLNSAIAFLENPESFPDEYGKVQKNFILSGKGNVVSALVERDDPRRMEAYIALLGKKFDLSMLDGLLNSSEGCVNLRPWLLDLKAKKYSAETIEKAETIQIEKDLGIREMTVADWKMVFTFKDAPNGGICITGYKGNETVVRIPENIGKKSVTVIGNDAFSPEKSRITAEQKETLRALTCIELPETIEMIGSNAFCCCSSLEKVVFPSKMPHLGLNAFLKCEKLADEKGYVCYGSVLFGYYGTEKELLISDGVSRVDDMVFEQKNNLEKVCISNNVSVSGKGLFRGCWNLKEVVLPSGLTEIADEMFCGCKQLIKMDIPETVAAIGERAFYGCSSLTRIAIPAPVSYVGEDAFKLCDAAHFTLPEHILNTQDSFIIRNGVLRKYRGIGGDVEIPVGVTDIAAFAFDGCRFLTSVVIPDGVTAIHECAFEICKALTSVVISNSVTSIDAWAFRGCHNLASVRIPTSVTYIGVAAFAYCPKLTIHAPAGSNAEQYAKENNIPFVVD